MKTEVRFELITVMKFKDFKSGKARTLFLLFFLNASYCKLIQVKIKLDC